MNCRFEGDFPKAITLEGNRINPSTRNTLSFKLSEVKEDVADASLEILSNENCELAEPNKKKPADEIFGTDTLCTSITVQLLRIKGQNLTTIE